MSLESKPSTTEIRADSPDILLVQDYSALGERLQESLQQDGYVSIAAGNGVEALRLAHDQPPRLIVLDLDLPVMNGWQFLERRRKDPALRDIPVIALGALPAAGARAHGADAHLEKPFDQSQLIAAIQRFLPAGLAQIAEAPQTDKIILVVDDDMDTRAAVAELLEENGFQ